MYLYLIIIILIVIGWTLTMFNNGVSGFPYGLTGGIVGVIIPTLLLIYSSMEPSAIDVYKGKTALEITYKDSVAIDSVVVFKKKTCP